MIGRSRDNRDGRTEELNSEQALGFLPTKLAEELHKRIEATLEGPLADPREELTPRTEYDVGDEIGRGGMGRVVEVHDENLGRRVAMKLIRPQSEGSGSTHVHRLIRRFITEARITGRLDHPGIVPVHELGVTPDREVYFTMPRVRGDTFHAVIDAAHRDGAGLTSIVSTLLRVTETVAYAHSRGIIHRDLKPSNIMVGDFGRVYVLDWGLAKDLNSEPQESCPDAKAADDVARGSGTLAETIDGSVIGTAEFMAPEQAQGDLASVGPPADVYALGAILYNVLAGRPPYTLAADSQRSCQQVLAEVVRRPPASLGSVAQNAPAELRAICEKAMSRSVADRYGSAEELADDLRAYMEGRVVGAHRTGIIVGARKWVARNRALATVAALVVMGAIGLGAYWIQSRQWEELGRRHEDSVTVERLGTAGPTGATDHPRHLEAMREWVDSATDVLGRLDSYRQELELLRATGRYIEQAETWTYESTLSAELDRELTSVIDQIERLGSVRTLYPGTEAETITGFLHDMRERVEFLESVEERSFVDHAAEWQEAIDSIAEAPQYNGLQITKQLGLVPVGVDPQSGLWEFAHLQTGEIPTRKAGKLQRTAATGLIFVLIPGGRFVMGAIPPTPELEAGSPNVDPDASLDEGPLATVELDAFFLSKYEMTQGQWLRIAKRNPSTFPGHVEGQGLSMLHPVDALSWDRCKKVLDRMHLALPTEAQWEYAARARTATVRYSDQALGEFENLPDRSLASGFNVEPDPKRFGDWNDGHQVTAPVGEFLPNGFGLHDMLGNVCEWCEDQFVRYADVDPESGTGERDPGDVERKLRAFRGSSWDGEKLTHARCAARFKKSAEHEEQSLGLRPARALTQ